MSDERSHHERFTPGRGASSPDPALRPVGLLRAGHLERVAGVVHGFTGRTFDPDDPTSGVLHLARRKPGDDAELGRRWEAVSRSLHPTLCAEQLVLLHQVHGAEVLRVEQPSGPLDVAGSADAAYTDVPGLVLAVRTADCVPVLVAGRRFVGVAHSGWRGTVAGVVPRLVQRLVAEGEEPSELVVALGPAISGEAYEVGPEVVEGLRRAGLDDDDFLHASTPRFHVDLRAAIRAQLRRAGVQRIHGLMHCTVHDPRFHSHRRDGAASGRQAAVIARCP